MPAEKLVECLHAIQNKLAKVQPMSPIPLSNVNERFDAMHESSSSSSSIFPLPVNNNEIKNNEPSFYDAKNNIVRKRFVSDAKDDLASNATMQKIISTQSSFTPFLQQMQEPEEQ